MISLETILEKKSSKHLYIGILVIVILSTLVYALTRNPMTEYPANATVTINKTNITNENILPVTNTAAAVSLTEPEPEPVIVPLVQGLTGSAQSSSQLIADDYDASFFENSVFVGDSISVGFETYCRSHSDSILTDTTYFLARVSGSAKAAVSAQALTSYAGVMPIYNNRVQLIEDSIAQMESIERVFICFGVNDLVGCSPEEYISNIQILADRILEKNPTVSIYMISVPCVVSSVSTGYLNNTAIAATNTLLQEACIENQWGFVNLTEYLMTDTFAIRSEYSSDGYVHQNNLAYDIWTRVLKNYAHEGKTS